jgi:hypothetical protein
VEPLLKEEFMKTEICIVCGVDTNVPKHLNVDLREHYVEGAGQMCKKCWDETYKTIN